ncbi:MAG: ATP synthase F1 subunit gamma [Oscillospiraceae bacterium]|nr:ATP synthase F1 subunit gamma [Oscillospiraceae bacterium]MBQ3880174.1 ATP synthase F1 subunit gamma [Oscillospiraceae bacterium]
MSSVAEIRHHIKAVSETAKITTAMHLIASAKMKHAMALHDSNNFYLSRIIGGIRYIIDNTDYYTLSPYVRDASECRTAAFVVIAGDKGLCGAFNNDVIRLAHRIIEEHPDESPLVYAIGHMAAEHFSHIGSPNLDYVHIIHEPNLQNARELGAELQSKYLSHEIDEIHIIYTDNVRLGYMVPTARHLLPLNPDDFANTDYGWVKNEIGFSFYPSEAAVFDTLVPSYLIGVIYSAMVESFISEQFSRMTAMESSMKNAGDMLSRLDLELNHARQDVITQEITEIISGSMLYKD